MVSASSALAGGRAAFEDRNWPLAAQLLGRADGKDSLAPEDLERLAVAAYMTGQVAESEDAWTRAHLARKDGGDSSGAARCAFWLGFQLLNSVEKARGMGWMARATRLLEGLDSPCAEQGYLLFFEGVRSVMGGEPSDALERFTAATRLGEDFGDPDLVALGRHGQGRALLRLGRIAEGTSLLDEVMVSVTTGELSPIALGDVYCSVIEAWNEIFDMGRAREWTAALNRWCESQPEIVPYRGACLIRRSELLQLGGHWEEAIHEALLAVDRLGEPPGQPALGAAFYQLGELHRLRGALSEARAAYEDASRHGRTPQPGLGLLRAAQESTNVAIGAIRRALESTTTMPRRATLLAAMGDMALEVEDLDSARGAVEELRALAERFDAPLIRGLAARASASLELAGGDPASALPGLEEALRVWMSVPCPYEVARTRIQIARASAAMGDKEGERMHLELARSAFEDLGAVPDVERLEAGREAPQPKSQHGLTPREVEVLGLVAQGMTNREVASALYISEKTVARHVSNIFRKIGVRTRAAATAYALKQGLG